MNKSQLKRAIAHKEQELHEANNNLSMSCVPRKKVYWQSKVDEYANELYALYAQRDKTDLIDQEVKNTKINAHKVLLAAAGHLENRAVTYDNSQGERSIPLVIELFNKIRGKDLTPADGWLIQVLLKIVRANQGNFKLDNFEDLAAYAALWGEESANDLHKQH